MSELTPNRPLTEISEKMELVGVVKKVHLGGAVIEVAGHEGLLHISQIRRKRVNNVSDFLKEGQVVHVWVRSVDAQSGRLQVTMIQPPAVDWNTLTVGQVYSGKVIRIEKYGVFVDIGAERPGLVHVSEIATEYVKNPEDVVSRDTVVEVKVINLDPEKNQIDLSMKALLAPREQEEVAPVVQETIAEVELPTAMAVAFERARGKSPAAVARAAKSGRKKSTTTDDIIRRTLEFHDQQS
ncbi:MAG: 30S ribosomal protein S1 [Anaerolineae bacterium]|nr:30S ribosomal protein S1 [Anaerolineae bacterium]